MKKLMIGCDLDDTIFSFKETYLSRFGTPKKDWVITRNVNNVLKHDRDFWINLPVLRRPEGFIPKLYCTSRVNNKSWTKKAIQVNDLPNSPVFQVNGWQVPKARYIKGRIDVFIDDSVKQFVDLNRAGIPCLLMDSPDNQEWGPIGRISSLDYAEIEDTYYLFKATMFGEI